MKFLIDADLPRSLKETFNRHGYSAIDAREVLSYASDDEIFEYSQKEGLILVTKDLGFAKTFEEKGGVGLVLVRLPYRFTSEKINKVFEKFLEDVDIRSLSNSITVIELDRYRTRRLRK